MRKIFYSFLFALPLIFVQSAVSQDSTGKHFKWSFSLGKQSNGSAVQLIATAMVDSGWGLFSSTMQEDLPNSRVVLDSSSKLPLPRIEEAAGWVD
jgi:thiol:disulfide interchange protein DsbD